MGGSIRRALFYSLYCRSQVSGCQNDTLMWVHHVDLSSSTSEIERKFGVAVIMNLQMLFILR